MNNQNNNPVQKNDCKNEILTDSCCELFASFDLEEHSTASAIIPNPTMDHLSLMKIDDDDDDGDDDHSELDEALEYFKQNVNNVKICQHLYGPSVRGWLLQLSIESYNANKILESIYYQTIAIGINLILKYRFGCGGKNTITKESIKEIFENEKKSTDPLINYIMNDLEQTTDPVSTEENISNVINDDPLKGIQTFIEKCRGLPKEWTVIQLCKMYDEHQWHKLKNEYYSSEQPLSITLFCYSRSELNQNEPITFHLNPKKNIYSDMLKLPEQIEQCFEVNNVPLSEYHIKLDNLASQMNKAIENLNSWFGPWIVIFSGKSKSPSQFEKTIFMEVDKFCKKIYSNKQIILISLIARRLDLLTNEKIRIGATEIINNYDSNNNNNNDNCNNKMDERQTQLQTDSKNLENLIKFLLKLKSKYDYPKGIEYDPCILIIDELLDAFYWEMLLPKQEITRISSLKLLFELYKKYKGQIKGGYLNVNLKNGKCVVNPDGTLTKMQDRITYFLNYWLPDYKCVYGKIPTKSEMAECLSNCDVFIYSGHGSSLQYLNARLMSQIQINCVAFLFGCESVALKSKGFQNEMIGSHLFLHLGYCPAVIGAISVISDLYTDISTTYMMASWIKCKTDGKKWAYPDVDSWNKGINKNKNNLLKLSNKIEHYPSLLKVLSNYRCETDIPIRMRCSMVCRGLPVFNQN